VPTAFASWSESAIPSSTRGYDAYGYAPGFGAQQRYRVRGVRGIRGCNNGSNFNWLDPSYRCVNTWGKPDRS
jgi:hypothetical protein